MLFPIDALIEGIWAGLGPNKKRFMLQAAARQKGFYFNLKTLSSIHIQISFDFSNLDPIQRPSFLYLSSNHFTLSAASVTENLL